MYICIPPCCPPAAEAMHVGSLIAAQGYFFPISDHVLSLKDDGTFYRFQVSRRRPRGRGHGRGRSRRTRLLLVSIGYSMFRLLLFAQRLLACHQMLPTDALILNQCSITITCVRSWLRELRQDQILWPLIGFWEASAGWGCRTNGWRVLLYSERKTLRKRSRFSMLWFNIRKSCSNRKNYYGNVTSLKKHSTALAILMLSF